MKKSYGELLQKYYAGRCTPEEKQRIEAWLESGKSDETPDLPNEIKSAHKEQMWQNIMAGIEQPAAATNVTTLYKKVIRYAAAACVAVGLFAGGYFALTYNQDKNATEYVKSKNQKEYKTIKNSPFTARKIKSINGHEYIAISFKNRADELVLFNMDEVSDKIPAMFQEVVSKVKKNS